jgi:hypothetical protein
VIKLVYCLRRRKDVTADDFYRYWLNEHAPKVRGVAATIGAIRYVQSHTCAPELNQLLKESRGLAQAFDGITEIWWDSAEAMAVAMATADGAAAMQMLLEDESTFIDFSRSSVFITEEKEIFNCASVAAAP